jgi:hypothetical protein
MGMKWVVLTGWTQGECIKGEGVEGSSFLIMYISPFRPLLAYFSLLTGCNRAFACVYRGILGDWRGYRRFSVCENVTGEGCLGVLAGVHLKASADVCD